MSDTAPYTWDQVANWSLEEVVECQSANRRRGVSDARLVILPSHHDERVPTFAVTGLPPNTVVPSTWAPHAARSGAEFADKFPRVLAETIVAVNDQRPDQCLYAVGGLPASMLGGGQASDWDTIAVGLPAEDTPEARLYRWNYLATFHNALCGALARSDMGAQAARFATYMSPGVYTVFVSSLAQSVKVQFIMRTPDTIAEVLYGFDVWPCQVAYDGERVLMTPGGMRAATQAIQVPDFAGASLNWEQRLAKYFARGYALVLPHATPLVPGRFALGAGTLAVDSVWGNLAVGAFEADEPARPSDYETGLVDQFENEGNGFINLKKVCRGETNYCIRNVSDRRGRDHAWWDSVRMRPWLDDPTLAHVISREAVAHLLYSLSLGAVNCGKMNVLTLRNYFGLTDEELGRVAAALAAAGGGLLVDALARRREGIVARYDALDPRIEWWVCADPTRQAPAANHTMSRHPVEVSPAAWYGALWGGGEVAGEPPGAALETLRGFEYLRQCRVVSAPCSMCTGTVVVGETNVATLPCGHVFHMSQCDECVGVLGWLTQNDTCPNCRSDLRRPPRGRRPWRRRSPAARPRPVGQIAVDL